MSIKAKTKTSKLLSLLSRGKQMTAAQLRQRCGFNSVNALTGTISHLNDSGYYIRSVPQPTGGVKYSMS